MICKVQLDEQIYLLKSLLDTNHFIFWCDKEKYIAHILTHTPTVPSFL